MPVYKLQVEWAMDSLLPRDVLCITPHFRDTGLGSNPQALCDDLADALGAKGGIPLTQVEVTAYVADQPPPSYPVGYAIRDAGGAAVSPHPREVALCLSFYSERNIPRQRGRLYIPAAFVEGAGALGVRPGGGARAAAGSFAPIFEDLGGVDVDWVVYSRVDDTARPVTNWWVDDEWDTVRSRGLRPTTRTAGTTSEA